ncbi:MAG: hypothetical protein HQL32_05860 [Planctomycetes bacterium]|nr:hypothetical protein [Planctomycetota bacterium]
MPKTAKSSSCFSIILWAALYYPELDDSQIKEYQTQAQLTNQEMLDEGALQGIQVKNSYAGQLGQLIEPVIKPMGHDWKVGIGLLGAFAAREVFVSTMGIVYSVGGEADEEDQGLHEAMRADLKPDGTPLWNLPMVMGILFFFVIAMQCISTLAVMKAETGGWKWPLAQLFTMNIIAYFGAVLIYQIGTKIL